MDLLAFMGGAGRWLLRALVVIAPLLVCQWTIALGQPYRARAGTIVLTPASRKVTLCPPTGAPVAEAAATR